MKANLLVAGITVAVILLIAEVALRLFSMGYPLWTEADIWTGWRLRPSASGWQRDEGEAWVRTNDAGWRDMDRATQKPANTLRIAVLGDSFVEGRQVGDEETLTAVAEKALSVCATLNGSKAEVLNFGVSGFGTAQELLALQQYVWPYQPDVVVLAFTPGNDVRNNSLILEGPAMKPVASVSGSQLAIDMGFRELPAFRKQMGWHRRLGADLVSSSRVLQLLYRATRSSPAPAVATESGEAGIDEEIYRVPTGAWAEAWDLTEILIAAMQEQVRSRSAKFLLMTTTQGVQVDPDPGKRAAAAKQLGVEDLFYAEHRLESLAKRQGFPVLALAPLLAKKAESSKAHYHGFSNTALGTGHWNAAGHRVAGEALAEALCNP